MNTTFENMGTTTINPHPTSIMIYMDGAALVTIRPTGVIEYGPDYTPDAAAKAFWEAIGAGNPLTTRVAELEMDAGRYRWLRDECHDTPIGVYEWTGMEGSQRRIFLGADELDEAIDAARGTE